LQEEAIIKYNAETNPDILREEIQNYLIKATDLKETIGFSKYIKILKLHPLIQKNEAAKSEIFWGEIFSYWKIADLLEGQTHQGVAIYDKLYLDRRNIHRWRRLYNGFTWKELEELKKEIRLPGLNTILNRIPYETILIIPEPGKYPIIYADPPWKYKFAQFSDVAIKDYKTLDVDQIINYGIEGKLLKEEYFNKNAVLFLWATNPKLVEALKVMYGWGFEYKTNICWDKIKPTSSTMGKWLLGRHELLLIGTKGSLPPPSPDKKIESIYQEEKTRHSQKPEYFVKLIENWYRLPEDSKYLQLFARDKPNERWEVLGNQLR